MAPADPKSEIVKVCFQSGRFLICIAEYRLGCLPGRTRIWHTMCCSISTATGWIATHSGTFANIRMNLHNVAPHFNVKENIFYFYVFISHFKRQDLNKNYLPKSIVLFGDMQNHAND